MIYAVSNAYFSCVLSNGWTQFYVPWDPTYYQAGAALIRKHVGVAFNISLWIFIIILVILLIFRIVGRFGRK